MSLMLSQPVVLMDVLSSGIWIIAIESLEWYLMGSVAMMRRSLLSDLKVMALSMWP